MAFALITNKIEKAFQNYFVSQSTAISSSYERPLQIYRGMDNEDKSAPCIIVAAQGSQEVVLYTGIMRCPVTITVKEMAADLSGSDMGTLADKVFDLALTSSFDLTAYDTIGGLGVMDTVVTDLKVRPEGDAWVSQLSLEVIAGHG